MRPMSQAITDNDAGSCGASTAVRKEGPSPEYDFQKSAGRRRIECPSASSCDAIHRVPKRIRSQPVRSAPAGQIGGDAIGFSALRPARRRGLHETERLFRNDARFAHHILSYKEPTSNGQVLLTRPCPVWGTEQEARS